MIWAAGWRRQRRTYAGSYMTTWCSSYNDKLEEYRSKADDRVTDIEGQVLQL